LPFSFPAGDELSAPTRYWRDGRLLVTHTFRSRKALPVVAARLAAQMNASPTLMTVPGGLLMSSLHGTMWWSVHLHDAGQTGTSGTIVGSPLRLAGDGMTPVAPASPALARWIPPGGMRVLDTRAIHGTRCHIHQVLTFAAPAASTLANFDIALDREGWARQPGPTANAVRHWHRKGTSLELIVVARDGGSGAVLHLTAPLPRASFARSFFGHPAFAPAPSSANSEPPCKDL
jgi:hypothetical protein